MYKGLFLAQDVISILKSLAWSNPFSFLVHGDAAWGIKNHLTNSVLEGGKAMSSVAQERAFAILDNHCPKAGGRQLYYHTYNSHLPRDEFFAEEVGRSSHTLKHLWYIHGWDWNLHKEDSCSRETSDSHCKAPVVKPSIRKSPLGWISGGLSTFFMLYSMGDHSRRKIWWLKRRDPDNFSYPHASMTFSRKVSRTEFLKWCCDGKKEVLLCIQSICQPFS